MRPNPSRKLTRFFVVKPMTELRLGSRFESSEDVLIRIPNMGKAVPGRAVDIGKQGLKIETHDLLEPGYDLQILFPKLPNQIQCYAQVVWSRKLEGTQEYESGVAIDSWFGIIEGPRSWKKIRGYKPKTDRRNTGR